MVVIWWILGILVGIPTALLLLLCIPLKIKFKTQDGEKKTVSRLTDSVEQDIKALGLSQEDAAILREMVLQAGPVEQEGEKEIFLSVGWLFFSFPIYPQKEKPPKEKPPQTPKPTSEKKEEAAEEKVSGIQIKPLLSAIKKSIAKPLSMIRKDLCVENIEVEALVAKEDTAQTALQAQKFLTVGYTALAFVQNVIKIKKANLQIQPDFSGKEEEKWNFAFCVKIHPVVWLGAAVCFVWKFFKNGGFDAISKPKRNNI